jgi:hypothetical protein
MRRERRSEIERFIALLLNQHPDSCWEWPAAKSPCGHGVFRLTHDPHGPRSTSAHRYLYQFVHGELWDDELVSPACGNMACVNPAHMEITDRPEVNRGIALRTRVARFVRDILGLQLEEWQVKRVTVAE